MDFSEKSIAYARSLSKELNISANFICSDIYKLPMVLDQQFDIVFTSGGVLPWLPDLGRWAEIIGRSGGGSIIVGDLYYKSGGL